AVTSFATRAGGFVTGINFLNGDFFPLTNGATARDLKAAEAEGREPDPIPVALRFHDLRQSHASLLLPAGHSIKAVSARLGHASVEITLKVYAHVMPADDERLTVGIGQLLKRA